ncbi:MAG: alpha/beta hydrolase [Kibdelosporangium sp.]
MEDHVRHQVVGGNGTRIAVRTSGPIGAPTFVLVHGWAQSSAVWSAQFADPALTSKYRLAAFDLRGHGDSELAEDYSDSAAWAGDVAAVLDLVGKPAILVGWSLGGAVVMDYLRRHGDRELAGIVLVGAATEMGKARPGARMGAVLRAAMPASLAEDPEIASPALAEFVRGMSASPLPEPTVRRMVLDSLRVPWQVRRAVLRRDFDSSDVLASIKVPTLVVHGQLDAVLDPEVGEYSHGKISGSEKRWLLGVGHLPFAERTEEFDEMLLEFAERVLVSQEVGE